MPSFSTVFPIIEKEREHDTKLTLNVTSGSWVISELPTKSRCEESRVLSGEDLCSHHEIKELFLCVEHFD